MITFKKYTSIENSYDEEFMNKVKAEMPKDLTYVVQEKVHGANVSFICDGNQIEFAKRTAILENVDNFFQHQEILEKYQNRVFCVFNALKEKYPDLQCISIFGELFGGMYPHPDVEKQTNLSLIQKGIYYTPGHGFYGFDIYLTFEQDKPNYLSVEETNSIFKQFGFFFAKTLFEGTLEECLQHSNRFESTIATDLGLPRISDNICEGVVIRPIIPMYLRNGNRVLIKNKNPKFAEIRKGRKNQHKEIRQNISNELKGALSLAMCYITENRLNNVISHIGEVNLSKDFGKVLGLYCKDILTDFTKDHNDLYLALRKEDQKQLNKEILKFATKVVDNAK